MEDALKTLSMWPRLVVSGLIWGIICGIAAGEVVDDPLVQEVRVSQVAVDHEHHGPGRVPARSSEVRRRR